MDLFIGFGALCLVGVVGAVFLYGYPTTLMAVSLVIYRHAKAQRDRQIKAQLHVNERWADEFRPLFKEDA